MNDIDTASVREALANLMTEDQRLAITMLAVAERYADHEQVAAYTASESQFAAIGLTDSASACYVDGLQQAAAGNYEAAARWALRSLAHSVGVFHADYKATQALWPEADPHRRGF